MAKTGGTAGRDPRGDDGMDEVNMRDVVIPRNLNTIGSLEGGARPRIRVTLRRLQRASRPRESFVRIPSFHFRILARSISGSENVNPHAAASRDSEIRPRDVKQGLGGDAAVQQARAPEAVVGFHQGNGGRRGPPRGRRRRSRPALRRSRGGRSCGLLPAWSLRTRVAGWPWCGPSGLWNGVHPPSSMRSGSSRDATRCLVNRAPSAPSTTRWSYERQIGMISRDSMRPPVNWSVRVGTGPCRGWRLPGS